MIKYWILKDSTGKYYTDNYEQFWSKDPDSAKNFFNEKEIEEHFKIDTKQEYDNTGLDQAEFPIEAKVIYIKK